MIGTPEILDAYLGAAGITGYEGWDVAEEIAALTMATEWVTGRTDREFYATAETRYFNGSGTPILELPDFLSVTTVTQGGVAVTAYQALPLNGTPKEKLRLSSGAYWLRPVSELGNIAIDATWGACTTAPQPILDAVCLVAATRGLGSGLVPDPTEQQLKSAQAFSLSYELASGKDQAGVLDAIYSQAERLLRGYHDFTGRRSRALAGTS